MTAGEWFLLVCTFGAWLTGFAAGLCVAAERNGRRRSARRKAANEARWAGRDGYDREEAA